MPSKKYKPEQIVSLLRQIEVAMANGKATPQACREAGIAEQTYYRWRKEYGGLRLDQAKRMKELEKENLKLKRLGLGRLLKPIPSVTRENQDRRNGLSTHLHNAQKPGKRIQAKQRRKLPKVEGKAQDSNDEEQPACPVFPASCYEPNQ